MRNFFGFRRVDLEELVVAAGAPKFRAQQIRHWVYDRGVRDFDAMHNLGRALQERLSREVDLSLGDTASRLVSRDGTKKYLSRGGAETVFIPERAVCVSSQVGCSLSCSFCHTGTQSLEKQLSAGDIVRQVAMVRAEEPQVSNVVFMGQGEPLLNHRSVTRAIEILTERGGMALTPRKITVSTSGVAPAIRKIAHLDVTLAVSLHAAEDALRTRIMGVNRQYPLDTLFESLREFAATRDTGKRKRITFEYTLLRGVNDSEEQAHQLRALLEREGVRALVNLIPFNAWPGAPYEGSDAAQIERFRAALGTSPSLHCTVRKTMGQDIYGACGQLRAMEQLN